MPVSEDASGGTWGDRDARTRGLSEQHPAGPYTLQSLNRFSPVENLPTDELDISTLLFYTNISVNNYCY